MMTLNFPTDKAGIPVLSAEQINQLGESIAADFCPGALEKPQEIDVDRFLTRYLGLTLDYKYLAHCRLYLGMTIFADSDRVPIFNPEMDRAEYIGVKAGTVILDSGLLNDNQEHCYRFTGAHEGAHNILHQGYFQRKMDRLRAGEDYLPMVQCRVDRARHSGQCGYRRSETDWLEWQANHLASAILMPRSMVFRVVQKAERTRVSASAGIEAVASTFNVSNDAAYYRMRELGLWRETKRMA